MNIDRLETRMGKRWKYFSVESDPKLACSCCGQISHSQEFDRLMNKVDELREACGFPLSVSSGYRCGNHPIEARKRKPGQHNIAAIDLRVSRGQAYIVLKHALRLGFTGIGVQQKGEGRFIHLDLREHGTVWSY